VVYVAKKRPIIALMYDFDKTLSTRDMQEYKFIPSLGMKPEDFWIESGKIAKNNGMDATLAYMYLMIKKASEHGISTVDTAMKKLGRSIVYYPGVEQWFTRINEYGKQHRADVEHYIISSGLKEIIEGSSVRKYFKEVYACEFYYDANRVPIWPKNVVNYTTKTQFLYRINKGCLDIYDSDGINSYTKQEDRRIPFRNMIYIGDGMSDIPCMKLVKVNGGVSIAVYANRQLSTAKQLIKDQRVNFVEKADYSAGKKLDSLIKKIIDEMIAKSILVSEQTKQSKEFVTR